mmetsp:Transcript_147925/g.412010  ORF Transcript_147925/g.412010 Transcript_147925/m.412010 type:complete len:294 (-) Transcript_147925:1675-2556(-)
MMVRPIAEEALGVLASGAIVAVIASAALPTCALAELLLAPVRTVPAAVPDHDGLPGPPVRPSLMGILARPALLAHVSCGSVGAALAASHAGGWGTRVHALPTVLRVRDNGLAIRKEVVDARRCQELEECLTDFDNPWRLHSALLAGAVQLLRERHSGSEVALRRSPQAQRRQELGALGRLVGGAVVGVAQEVVPGALRQEGVLRQVSTERIAVAEVATGEVRLWVDVVEPPMHPHGVDHVPGADVRNLHVPAVPWVLEAREDACKIHDVVVVVGGHVRAGVAEDEGTVCLKLV